MRAQLGAMIAAALTLSGCAQAPVAAMAPVSLVIAAPPAVVAPATRLVSLPVSALQSGVWQLSYRLGTAERSDDVPLDFQPDGRVSVGDPALFSPEFPNRWDARGATFEGNVRRDFLNPGIVSRDRLDLTIDSPGEMTGTLSMRVNFRWVSLPVTARLLAPAAKAFAVTPGTIVDTAASERIE